MAQVRITEVWIVHDTFALPGMEWWARLECAEGGDPFPVMATGLCDSPCEALAALASKLSRWIETATREEEPA